MCRVANINCRATVADSLTAAVQRLLILQPLHCSVIALFTSRQHHSSLLLILLQCAILWTSIWTIFLFSEWDVDLTFSLSLRERRGIARFWSAIRWTLHEEQEVGTLSSDCTVTLSSTQTLSVCKITDTPNITSNNPLQPLLFCMAISNPAEAQFQLIYLGKCCRFFAWRKEVENRKNSVPHQQFQLSDNLGLEASSLERICY